MVIGNDKATGTIIQDFSEREMLLKVQSELEIAQGDLSYASQEIHDNLGYLSNLVYIHLQLLADTPVDRHSVKVQEINGLVTELNREIKQLSIELSASRTVTGNLDQLLAREVERLKKLDLFKVAYIEPRQWPTLTSLQSIVLFRMLQELLNNVLKHSKATLLKIEVFQSGSFLNIHLEDDGLGFDTKATLQESHLGMKHLHERANAIHAQLHVHSKNDQGTAIHLRIPTS